MSQHWGDGHQLCQYQCREWWWRTPNQGRGLKTQNFTIQRSYALDSGLKHGVRKERCSHAYEQVRTLTSDAGADLMERLTMIIDQEEADCSQGSGQQLHQASPGGNKQLVMKSHWRWRGRDIVNGSEELRGLTPVRHTIVSVSDQRCYITPPELRIK